MTVFHIVICYFCCYFCKYVLLLFVFLIPEKKLLNMVEADQEYVKHSIWLFHDYCCCSIVLQS